MSWHDWWIWVATGFALGIIEVILPGYLFVGFAFGAITTGVWLGLTLPGSAWMLEGFGNALTVFAILSLIAWIALRRLMGVRHGQVKKIDHDINDN